MGQREFLVSVLQVRGQRDDLAVELEVTGMVFQPPGKSPSSQPLQQVQAGKSEILFALSATGEGLCQPLDEFPVLRGKQFLLVRRARRQLDDFGDRPDLLASAGTEEVQPDLERVQRGMIRRGLRGAQDPQRRAGSFEVRQRRREKPVFQFLKFFLFLFGLLQFGEAGDVGVGRQFDGQGAVGPQEQDGHLLEAGLPLRRHQTRPPVRPAKVFSRKGKLLEIILQQQPAALGIGAGGKDPQELLAFGDARPGVGKLAAQTREGTVGLGKNGMMSLVFSRPAGKSRRTSVFVREFWHGSECIGITRYYLGIEGRGRSTRKLLGAKQPCLATLAA